MSRLILDDYNPNVYICHMRSDRKYTRSYYGGYFEPNPEEYETSCKLVSVYWETMVGTNWHIFIYCTTDLVQQSNFNTSTFIQFEYQSLNDNNKKRQWSAVVPSLSTNIFYIGDNVLFRCKASPFLYATGVIWEKEWKNGTMEIVQSKKPTLPFRWLWMLIVLKHCISANHTTSVLGSNYVELSVELLNEDMKRVSCHIPPWNSTGWVTQSIPLTVKRMDFQISIQSLIRN